MYAQDRMKKSKRVFQSSFMYFVDSICESLETKIDNKNNREERKKRHHIYCMDLELRSIDVDIEQKCF